MVGAGGAATLTAPHKLFLLEVATFANIIAVTPSRYSAATMIVLSRGKEAFRRRRIAIGMNRVMLRKFAARIMGATEFSVELTI